MAIAPISMPSAAGLPFGKSDVRHFSEGDDMSVPGLSNPTRHLAQRDNDLAAKVNELVAAANNREQFIPLPLVRTQVPPLEEFVVTNYRIPAGFEARVLNATVSATPSSTDIELNVYYNQSSFGATTGTAVVTTSSEFTAGTSFNLPGEYVVSLKNKSTVTLELAASVMLTMRPIGAVGSLLVGATIVGEKGEKGDTGEKGDKGDAGQAGGPGVPGMEYKGTWALGASYNKGDVVTSQTTEGAINTYICIVTDANSPKNPSETGNANWNLLARAPVYTFGSVSLSEPVTGTLHARSGYKSGKGVFGIGTYNGTMTGTVALLPLNVTTVDFPSVPTGANYVTGMAFLSGAAYSCFAGSALVQLPSNDKVTFSTSNTTVTVVPQGNVIGATAGTTAVGPCNEGDTQYIGIFNTGTQPVCITFSGFAPYYG